MSKVLAVDYGEKNIGLAISDELGIVATPLPTMKAKSLADAVQMVHQFSHSHNATKIIVGLPLGAKGEETKQSMQTRYFARALGDTNGTDILFWDESFSTKQAQKQAITKKQKANIDSGAARVILQEYLDSQSASAPSYVPQSPKMNVTLPLQ